MTEPLWMIWWAWMCAALVLGILEILLPGFIFLGFAIGAAAVGVITLLPLGLTLPVVILIFAALSLAAWLVMRRVFALPTGQVKHFSDDING